MARKMKTMDGNQAASTQYQVKHEGVKKRQHNGQNAQADSGGDDAGLHKRWFPFAESFYSMMQ